MVYSDHGTCPKCGHSYVGNHNCEVVTVTIGSTTAILPAVVKRHDFHIPWASMPSVIHVAEYWLECSQHGDETPRPRLNAHGAPALSAGERPRDGGSTAYRRVRVVIEELSDET